ncbi:hypothetical protein [Pseudonocardia hydrocarbonoxydans]|uniref:Helix-turn-helix domain-containing protein n=1 Tax=Pseudonocardia hydrocarbonoxydans TaxID=76726 RepID=A0A4Y3WTZ8_9PSEU|nr:hypothetical protein [Pseudonocardia hydrocarbonoxydans]GEC20816.1 hypothetical protein PHY01_30990 [Pseudonocardia hydrocarbonoxydans]
MYELPADLMRLGLFEWRRALLGRRLVPAGTFLFGFFVAAYGDPDGSAIFPGQKKIKEHAGFGNEEAVRGHLRKLEDARLFLRVGEAVSYRDRAREYVLTVPADVGTAAGFTGIPPEIGRYRIQGVPPETEEATHRFPVPEATGNREPTSSVPPPSSPPPAARAGAREPWRGREAIVDDVVELIDLPDVWSADRVRAALLSIETGPRPPNSVEALMASLVRKGTRKDVIERLLKAEKMASPARAHLPPPCGQCNAGPLDAPTARVTYPPGVTSGSGDPCPRCHPSAVARAS